MRRVLIVGASSLVGSHLAMRLRDKTSVIGTYCDHKPPIDSIALIRLNLRLDTPWAELIKLTKPDTIFYCAAERDEKRCQEQPLNALALNAEIPLALARSLHATPTKLVYFSTSKVFSGEKGDYAESDPTDATTHYGKSKARGEELLADFENAFVLRLGTLYGLGPVPSRSLLNRLLDQLSGYETVSLIQDEMRSFQSTQWIGEVGARIVAASASEGGLYQVPSPPKESYYSFAVQLADALKVPAAQLLPVDGVSFGSEPRGRDTSLKGDLFAQKFGMKPQSTANYLDSLAEGLRTGLF